QVGARAQEAAALARAAAEAAAALEQARRRVAELKEQETHERTARRQAEAALAQVTARRDALAELERERVGLAPAAQALLKARARGCGRSSRATRSSTVARQGGRGGARCDGLTVPCSWPGPRPGVLSSGAPSSRGSSRKCERHRSTGATLPRRWSERSPSSPPPRPRVPPRGKRPSALGSRSSKRAR